MHNYYINKDISKNDIIVGKESLKDCDLRTSQNLFPHIEYRETNHLPEQKERPPSQSETKKNFF